MKENAKWVAPDPSIIQKRFFPDRETAAAFSKRMFEDGYMTSIKTDGFFP